MANCSYCNSKVTPAVEKSSMNLYGEPVCTKADCEKKANAKAKAAAEVAMTPTGKVLALLARRGFVEQSVKGFWLLDNGSTKMAVDLKGPSDPKIGILQINGDILEEGHGISLIDDIRRDIEGILKSKAEPKQESTIVQPPGSEKAKSTNGKSVPVENTLPATMLAALEKHGWSIESGKATKVIDGRQVTIDLTNLEELSRINKCGKAVQVEGYAYEFGLNNIIDAELKSLFGEIAKAQAPVQKPTPRPEPKPQETALTQINVLSKIQDLELSTETVLKYLCPDATLEEAAMFLQVCKLRNLNPFVPGEVFLIKYDKTQPASIVVGKYAFTKKADEHPDFRGYTAGIIVLDTTGKQVEREGTFYLPASKMSKPKEGEVFETLLGGWAKVKRLVHGEMTEFVEKVALQECIQYKKDGAPMRRWETMPGTMVRKNALVRALREAFPAELGGLYDESEITGESERR